MRFLDPRRQPGIAHLPARKRAIGPIDRDHPVGPGIAAVVALGAEPIGIGAVGVAVMPVMAVHQFEPAFPQQGGEVVLAIEGEAVQAAGIR